VSDDKRRRPDLTDDELDELVGSAMAREGQLFPTTEDEVGDAEKAGVDFEGDLPAELAELREPEEAPVASRRVVSLEEARRERAARDEPTARGSSWATHLIAGALGAAAAAALFAWRADLGETTAPRPAGDPPATGSAEPVALSPIEIDPVTGCSLDCCAGAECSAAEGELRKCGSGRQCVLCDVGESDQSLYRVRIGRFFPSDKIETGKAKHLDLCARVGGSAWSCEPAWVEPTTETEWRHLPTLATAQDAAAGLELQLRFGGTKEVVGRWKSAVRINPTTLCRGIGVAIETEKEEHLGSLSFFLDDAHFVELERGDDFAELKAHRARFTFADVVPVVFETTGKERFALTVGPLSKPAAELLRWALLEEGAEATLGLGNDYEGAPRPLP